MIAHDTSAMPPSNTVKPLPSLGQSRRRDWGDGSTPPSPPNGAPSNTPNSTNTQIPDKIRALKLAKPRPKPKPKPLLFYLPNHQKRDDGYYLLPSSDGGVAYRYCGPIEFIAKTRDTAGASWGTLVRFYDADGKVHIISIPQAWLAGDGGELRQALLDQGFYIAPTAKGRAAFMELLSLVWIDARARAVLKVGWADEAFVLPDHSIRTDHENLVIYQGPDALDHVYRVNGLLRDWQEQVARYGPGNNQLIFAICCAFVGPLLSLLKEEGGGINLRGPSSIGKSTAIVAAGSVWGGLSFVRQWRATMNALEGICLQHNDTLLCLDELAQLDERDSKVVAYMIANGMGKARATRSGQLRAAAQWCVLFLSTGEISLADHAGRDSRGAKRSAAGQEVRVLDIEADAGAGMGLFEVLHDAASPEALSRKIKEGASNAYGSAGPAFVERLCHDKDAYVEAAARDITDFVKEHVPANADGQVSRGARRFALVATAGEMAIEMGVLPWKPGVAKAAAANAFNKWLNGRGGTGSAEDREAIAKVRGFLELHGSSRFEAYDSLDDEPRTFNRAGFWRDGEAGREFLVTSETWRTELCAGMDSNRVAKVLGNKGLLRKDSKGRNSITVTLPGIGKARCYAIHSRIFAEDGHE